MTFVLLYGPPAVGKLTVARELAELTGFKLFHNHLSIDVVEPIFSRTSPSFGRTVTAIRKLVFEEAARENVDLIFTYVYAHPQDRAQMDWMLEAVEHYGARTQLVHLVCTPEKLRARIVADSRRGSGKIVDRDFLNELLSTKDFFTPYPARPSLKLDTTDTPPSETAAAIAAHLARTA